MKLNLDMLLIVGMAICYTAGQFFAAYRFATVAGVLLIVFLYVHARISGYDALLTRQFFFSNSPVFKKRS